MKKSEIDKVHELVIDEWIWVIFIILSFLNIRGDECLKDYCYNHNNNNRLLSKKIFKFTVFVSLIIYIYIASDNINKYSKQKSKDNSIMKTRCLSSILVVAAAFLSLMVQFNDNDAINPDFE